MGRAARSALFAAGAVALSECSTGPSPQPLYGAVCVTDACGVAPQDASQEAASDASEDASDASVDVAADAAAADSASD